LAALGTRLVTGMGAQATDCRSNPGKSADSARTNARRGYPEKQKPLWERLCEIAELQFVDRV
jgi:hypothetical protein